MNVLQNITLHCIPIGAQWADSNFFSFSSPTSELELESEGGETQKLGARIEKDWRGRDAENDAVSLANEIRIGAQHLIL